MLGFQALIKYPCMTFSCNFSSDYITYCSDLTVLVLNLQFCHLLLNYYKIVSRDQFLAVLFKPLA